MIPKVSICMPTYNYDRYLPEAVESVLHQSYGDFEFIIRDDHSNDNSVEVIKRYAEKDKRIHFNVNAQNIGMVHNWNSCFHDAKGDYVLFLFGDDMLASQQAIARMVAVLDANEGIALVAAARNVIDEQSRVKKVLVEYKGKVGYSGTQIIQDCLIDQRNRIGEPSAVMFRRNYAMRGFDPRYRQAVDLEMWFHILEQGNFAYVEEPLCSFRDHPEQQTKANVARLSLSEEAFLLLNDYAHKSYVKLSRINKEYMFYVPVYAVWKQYKKERISRKAALDTIRKRYNIVKFFSLYPLFKMYKFIRSIMWSHTSRIVKNCNCN